MQRRNAKELGQELDPIVEVVEGNNAVIHTGHGTHVAQVSCRWPDPQA